MNNEGESPPPLVSRRRFGAALVAARGALGLSVIELAEQRAGSDRLDAWVERLIECERGLRPLDAPEVVDLAHLYGFGPRRINALSWRPVLDTSTEFPEGPYARLAVAVVGEEPLVDRWDLVIRFLTIRRVLGGDPSRSLDPGELAILAECERVAPARLERELRLLDNVDGLVRADSTSQGQRLVVPHTGVLIGTGPGGTLLMRQRYRDNLAGPGRGTKGPPVGRLIEFSAEALV